MNELHLFAGSGGGILGGMLLGHRCIGAVEIEPYCQQVLLARQRDGMLPEFPIFSDILKFDARPYRGYADIVAGGFPCQDISAAGKGAGIKGESSGLWKEMARVVREVQPRYVFVENSPNLVSRGLGVVLGDLASMGFDARWGVLGADTLGAPHRRDRIWIVANAKRDKQSREEPCSGPTGRVGRIEQSMAWNRYWESAFAEFRRMDDGLPRSVDRTDSLRNAQVPVVAATAWNLLR